jgi:hypothetical protein
MQAKLGGALALEVSGKKGKQGPFAVARALLKRLSEADDDSIATDDDAVTQTIVTSDFQERTMTYEIVELRADRSGWFGIIGALALAREGKQPRVIPFAALNPLAQALVTAGDAQVMGRAPGVAAPRRPSTPSPSP